jgi:hypothetical protein
MVGENGEMTRTAGGSIGAVEGVRVLARFPTVAPKDYEPYPAYRRHARARVNGGNGTPFIILQPRSHRSSGGSLSLSGWGWVAALRTAASASNPARPVFPSRFGLNPRASKACEKRFCDPTYSPA